MATRRVTDTMAGRIMLVLVVGLGLFHAASLTMYSAGLDRELTAQDHVRTAERLIGLRQALKAAQTSDREELAHRMSGGTLDAHWGSRALAVDRAEAAEGNRGLERALRTLDPGLAASDVRIGASPPTADTSTDSHLIMVSLAIGDDTWANVSIVRRGHVHTSTGSVVMATTTMAIGAAIAAWLLVRWTTRPLQRLASASRAFSGTGSTLAMTEDGPREVQDAARAFNEMQSRIRSLIEDRTLSLAAISHDLKTPLTRLRFQIEDMDNVALRHAIVTEIDEMEHMIDGALALLRGEIKSGNEQRVELRALLDSVCTGMSDRGSMVTFSGSGRGIVRGHPLDLKRAFANIIENAVKYGDRADVSIVDVPGRVEIVITDDGPGIPDDQMFSVFKPFYRVDISRRRETGGVGLGLTVAERIISSHNGSIALANLTPRGLRVTIHIACSEVIKS